MKNEFSSRHLVSRALRGEAIPRPASGPLAVHFCARWAGVSLRDYTLEARVLAECVVRYYERFRPDAVWLSADTWVSAQAMGAPVAFPARDQPLGGTGAPLVRSGADLERIPPPDPGTQGRWPLMLEALGRIRRALGEKVFVVACFDQYPFSLACALMGMETLMLKMAEDRPLVEALLARCAEYTVAYARALADAGADMLSGGDSPAGLLGPKRYRAIALPWEQRVIQQIRKTEPRPSGSVPGYGLRTRNISSTNNSDLCSTASARPLPVSLHICGNATPILPAMAQSGADVLELDHQVDLPGAAAITGPDLALWGNLDPVRVLSQGTPAQVRAATCALLESMAACGHRRFVLSSGCTLAVETPAENLDAMLNVARQANPNPL